MWPHGNANLVLDTIKIHDYCGEHFLKLVLNCCDLGPKLLRASVN